MGQPCAKQLGSRHEATRSPDGFAESSDVNPRTLGCTELFDEPSSRLPIDPSRVGFVDDHGDVIGIAEGRQLRNRGGITVHAKKRVGRQKGKASLVAMGCDQLTQRVDVTVGIDDGFGPAQTTAVDDASVVERVAKDDIVGRGQGRNRSQIGGVTTGKEEGLLGPFKGGDGGRQLLMNFRKTGHQRARTCPNAA